MAEELTFHYYPRCSRSTKWFNEACFEKGIKEVNLDYTFFPQRFYKTIQQFSQDKIFDFCFIGSLYIQQCVVEKRSWILDFIKSRFTINSYLQFTDKETKEKLSSLGQFDYSHIKSGFVPKKVSLATRDYFDEEYYKILCQSKFSLCPAGDIYWSMRFFESLMCKTIPIVRTKDETFRSKEESLLDYRYYLSSEPNILFKQDWVDHNYGLFLKYHTL